MRTEQIPAYVSVERHAVSGAWLVTGLLNDGCQDYYHTKQYYGYTKRQAVAMFTEQHRDELVNA